MKIKYPLLIVFVVATVIILSKFDNIKMSIGNRMVSAKISGEVMNKNFHHATETASKVEVHSKPPPVYETHGKNSPIVNTMDGSTTINYGEK